jgi:SAM-dependent methyltransferase
MKTAVQYEVHAQPEWFASWFDSEHYHKLYAHRDDHEAAEFITRLITCLQPAGGSSILDLGCGSGRHSRYLASMGFDITGLDLSAESIRRAKQSERLNLHFTRQDMRQPFGTDAFHYVFNLFTSFGYFEDPSQDIAVIQNVAKSLKGGGHLVLDYMNVVHVQSRLKAEEAIERDGVIYRLSRWADANYIFKRIAIMDDERKTEATRLEYTERVAKLTLADFRSMFDLCGLAIEAIFGDYRLSPFSPQASPRLIIIAQKSRDSLAPELLPRQLFADPAEGLRSHAQI